MIQYLLYLKNLKFFESVCHACDKNLPRAIGAIQEAVKNGGEPFERVRSLLDKLPSASASEISAVAFSVH